MRNVALIERETLSARRARPINNCVYFKPLRVSASCLNAGCLGWRSEAVVQVVVAASRTMGGRRPPRGASNLHGNYEKFIMTRNEISRRIARALDERTSALFCTPLAASAPRTPSRRFSRLEDIRAFCATPRLTA